MSLSVLSIDSIIDVAESLGISNLAEDPARAIAMDVEYRVHEIAQEAIKFMRHSKRTILTTQDIEMALRALNIEPLYGFGGEMDVQFRDAVLAAGQPPLYYLDEQEVDFEKIVNTPLPKVPRDISYTSHWLAIEGVQPAIPENPQVTDLQDEVKHGSRTSMLLHASSRDGAAQASDGVEVKPLVKHVLSQELQLYFEKVTSALLDETNPSLNAAAITSLRSDPGLHQLLPYFVHFIADKMTNEMRNVFVLNMMMQMTNALLENNSLFIEPYVHQLMAPILTCVVAKRLGGDVPLGDRPDSIFDHYSLRDLAASILGKVCDRFGDAYQTLRPRVTRTLLKAFLDNKKPLTTHYGAIQGLRQLGPQVVRFIILPNVKLYCMLLKAPLDEKKTPDNDNGVGPDAAIPEQVVRKEEAERNIKALVAALESLADDEVANAQTLYSGMSFDEAKEALLKEVGPLVAQPILAKNDEVLVRSLLPGPADKKP